MRKVVLMKSRTGLGVITERVAPQDDVSSVFTLIKLGRERKKKAK